VTKLKKISLALSGGGIRAYAQIGVYRLLKENNFDIESVSGTSMGSIIASFIAAGADPNQLEKVMFELEREFQEKQVFLKPSLRVLPMSKQKLNGFVDADMFEEMIQRQFDEFNVTNLSDLRKPISITSVDLISGKLVIFTNMPDAFIDQPDKIIISNASIAEAVRASCSFPIVFSTKRYEHMQLVDGGVKMNLPVTLLKAMKAKNIVSITMDGTVNYKASSKLLDVAFRIIDIMTNANQESDRLISDFNVNIDVSKYHTFEAGKGKKIVDQGYQEAKTQLDQILLIFQ
jgi:NTE family protein